MTSERGHDVSPHAGRRGGAFSLIEVMLGVLILALGLLGLAAVMPAVVAQQRNAANTTLGEGALESAKDYLSRHRGFNRLTDSTGPSGIGSWYWNELWSQDYEWEDPVELLDTGLFELYFDNINAAVLFPISERVWPGVASGRGSPIFVWDIVARRVPPKSRMAAIQDPLDTLNPEIELVIFVRRIDPGIKPSGGKTVWSALGMGGDPYDQPDFLAVGEEGGIPTLDGSGLYSRPKRLNVVFEEGPNGERNRLYIDGEYEEAGVIRAGGAAVGGGIDEILFSFASTPGQTLVDNLGNKYTVRGPDKEEGYILIDPPVPSSVSETMDEGDGSNERWDVLHQIVFTLQVPAAVEVVTIRAVNPKE